jgi:hypothetical protein
MVDLALVFPGAFHLIAGSDLPREQRERARQLVHEGAPLKDVARVLGLPLWMRRLPPEAFRGALAIPSASETFSRRITSHLPANAAESATWLKSVAFGVRACNYYFALWLAAQPLYREPCEPEELLAVLAAYAWYSNSEAARAHSLVLVPWRPEMALETAVCAAKSWLNRLRLVMQLRPGTIDDPWLASGEAMGLTFVPITEASQILAEAHGMQNCADQYANRLACDRCRLFSVRRRNQRVATLEIAAHPREAGVLTITQLKARHNMPAAGEVWQAAHAWLATQKNLKRLALEPVPERRLDAEVWQSLMQPYRTTHAGAPWLPELTEPIAFATLEANLADLARRIGISSWLFT